MVGVSEEQSPPPRLKCVLHPTTFGLLSQLGRQPVGPQSQLPHRASLWISRCSWVVRSIAAVESK
jgi:hypothetical protein